jgi:hypothetical protein
VDNYWRGGRKPGPHEPEYVQEFKAVHPQLGQVWGDFDDKVFATSEKAFRDFYSKYQPFQWDPI